MSQDRSSAGKGELVCYKLSDLQKLVDGNHVALVGNSLGLIGTELGAQIDAFPVVARLNRGFPWHHPSDLGTKTTIWANNEMVDGKAIDQLDPKFFMYSAPMGEDPPGDYFYRKIVEDKSGFRERCRGWSMDIPLLHEIHQGVGRKSSSGLRLLMVLFKLCKPTQITLFGFDFLKSKTWYWACNRENHSPAHDGDKEEAYVRSLPPEPEIWLMKSGATKGGLELLNRGSATSSSPGQLREEPEAHGPRLSLDPSA